MTLSCIYSEIMFTIISFFQKLIKGGRVGIRAEGGLKIFQKLINGGRRLFGTREYGASQSLESPESSFW